MPRNPKTVETMLELVYRKCKYRWTPNPTMWRNNNMVWLDGKFVKMIPCPNCNTRNYIAPKEIEKLLEWYKGHEIVSTSHRQSG